ncbi:uncharacterized protein LOC135923494 [Gordionus sp. m RMFG-2023]|uniref:uncharacterized protein LOC135923494 n=1 Tax=Gordionus sp. m RMFG-2023 TaxID=3053472 RepID=UPI0031FCF70F
MMRKSLNANPCKKNTGSDKQNGSHKNRVDKRSDIASSPAKGNGNENVSTDYNCDTYAAKCNSHNILFRNDLEMRKMLDFCRWEKSKNTLRHNQPELTELETYDKKALNGRFLKYLDKRKFLEGKYKDKTARSSPSLNNETFTGKFLTLSHETGSDNRSHFPLFLCDFNFDIRQNRLKSLHLNRLFDRADAKQCDTEFKLIGEDISSLASTVNEIFIFGCAKSSLNYFGQTLGKLMSHKICEILSQHSHYRPSDNWLLVIHLSTNTSNINNNSYDFLPIRDDCAEIGREIKSSLLEVFRETPVLLCLICRRIIFRNLDNFAHWTDHCVNAHNLAKDDDLYELFVQNGHHCAENDDFYIMYRVKPDDEMGQGDIDINIKTTTNQRLFKDICISSAKISRCLFHNVDFHTTSPHNHYSYRCSDKLTINHDGTNEPISPTSFQQLVDPLLNSLFPENTSKASIINDMIFNNLNPYSFPSSFFPPPSSTPFSSHIPNFIDCSKMSDIITTHLHHHPRPNVRPQNIPSLILPQESVHAKIKNGDSEFAANQEGSETNDEKRLSDKELASKKSNNDKHCLVSVTAKYSKDSNIKLPTTSSQSTEASPNSYRTPVSKQTSNRERESPLSDNSHLSNSNLFTNHLLSAGTVECPKCDLVLGSSRSLGGHMTMMHSRNSCKTLKCPKCNWHYKYQETLEIHMKEKHPVASNGPAACVYCLNSESHPRLARGENYSCGYKPYKCEICNYSTTTKGNLSIHMQSDKHANNVNEMRLVKDKAEISDVPSLTDKLDDFIEEEAISKSLNIQGMDENDKSESTLEDTANRDVEINDFSEKSALLSSPYSSCKTSNRVSIFGATKMKRICKLCPFEAVTIRDLRLHMMSGAHLAPCQTSKPNSVQYSESDHLLSSPGKSMSVEKPLFAALFDLDAKKVERPRLLLLISLLAQALHRKYGLKAAIEEIKQKFTRKWSKDSRSNNDDAVNHGFFENTYACCVCYNYSCSDIESLKIHMADVEFDEESLANPDLANTSKTLAEIYYQHSSKNGGAKNNDNNNNQWLLDLFRLDNATEPGNHSQTLPRIRSRDSGLFPKIYCTLCDRFLSHTEQLENHESSPFPPATSPRRYSGEPKKPGLNRRFDHHFDLLAISRKCAKTLLSIPQGYVGDLNILNNIEKSEEKTLIENDDDKNMTISLSNNLKYSSFDSLSGDQLTPPHCYVTFCESHSKPCVSPLDVVRHLASHRIDSENSHPSENDLVDYSGKKAAIDCQISRKSIPPENYEDIMLRSLLSHTDLDFKALRDANFMGNIFNGTSDNAKEYTAALKLAGMTETDAGPNGDATMDNSALLELARSLALKYNSPSTVTQNDTHNDSGIGSTNTPPISASALSPSSMLKMALTFPSGGKHIGAGFHSDNMGRIPNFDSHSHAYHRNRKEDESREKNLEGGPPIPSSLPLSSSQKNDLDPRKNNRLSDENPPPPKLAEDGDQHENKASPHNEESSKNFPALDDAIKSEENPPDLSQLPNYSKQLISATTSESQISTSIGKKSIPIRLKNSAKCNLCHMRFNKASILTAHVNRVHKGETSILAEYSSADSLKKQTGIEKSKSFKDDFKSKSNKDRNVGESLSINGTILRDSRLTRHAKNRYDAEDEEANCDDTQDYDLKNSLFQFPFPAFHSSNLKESGGVENGPSCTRMTALEKFWDPSRPFKCPLCLESFTQKNILLVHFNSVSHLHRLKRSVLDKFNDGTAQNMGEFSQHELMANYLSSLHNYQNINNDICTTEPLTPASSLKHKSFDPFSKSFKAAASNEQYYHQKRKMSQKMYETKLAKFGGDVITSEHMDTVDNATLVANKNGALQHQDHLSPTFDSALASIGIEMVRDYDQNTDLEFESGKEEEKEKLKRWIGVEDYGKEGDVFANSDTTNYKFICKICRSKEGEDIYYDSLAKIRVHLNENHGFVVTDRDITSFGLEFNGNDGVGIVGSKNVLTVSKSKTPGCLPDPDIKRDVNKPRVDDDSNRSSLSYHQRALFGSKYKFNKKALRKDFSRSARPQKNASFHYPSRSKALLLDDLNKAIIKHHTSKQKRDDTSNLPKIPNFLDSTNTGPNSSSFDVSSLSAYDSNSPFPSNGPHPFMNPFYPPHFHNPNLLLTPPSSSFSPNMLYNGMMMRGIPPTFPSHPHSYMYPAAYYNYYFGGHNNEHSQMFLPPFPIKDEESHLEDSTDHKENKESTGHAFEKQANKNNANCAASSPSANPMVENSTSCLMSNKRARTRISDEQLKILRSNFDINNSPTEEQIKNMSEKSGLPAKVIKHWFRNTLFKERQRNKDSPYNFNNPPLARLASSFPPYEMGIPLISQNSNRKGSCSPPPHDDQKCENQFEKGVDGKDWVDSSVTEEVRMNDVSTKEELDEKIRTETRNANNIKGEYMSDFKHLHPQVTEILTKGMDDDDLKKVPLIANETVALESKDLSTITEKKQCSSAPNNSICEPSQQQDFDSKPLSAITSHPRSPYLLEKGFLYPSQPYDGKLLESREYGSSLNAFFNTQMHLSAADLAAAALASGGRRANRTRFTDSQIKVLQDYFEKNAYPKDDELDKLSKILGLSPRVIVVWFQNARQKARKHYETNPNLAFNFSAFNEANNNSINSHFTNDDASPSPLLDDNNLGVRSPPSYFEASEKDYGMDEIEPKSPADEIVIKPDQTKAFGDISYLHRYYETYYSQYINKSSSSQPDVHDFSHNNHSTNIDNDMVIKREPIDFEYCEEDRLTCPRCRVKFPSQFILSVHKAQCDTKLDKNRKPTAAFNYGQQDNDESSSSKDTSAINGRTSATPSITDKNVFDGSSDYATQLQNYYAYVKLMNEAASFATDINPTSYLQQNIENDQFPGYSFKGDKDTSCRTPDNASNSNSDHMTSGENIVTGSTNNQNGSLNDQATTEDGNKKRLRTNISPEQLLYLHRHYQTESNPSKLVMEKIAKDIGLKKRVVQVWFQNARARDKKSSMCYYSTFSPTTVPVSNSMSSTVSAGCKKGLTSPFFSPTPKSSKRCPFCNMFFRARSLLELHVKIKHPHNFDDFLAFMPPPSSLPSASKTSMADPIFTSDLKSLENRTDPFRTKKAENIDSAMDIDNKPGNVLDTNIKTTEDVSANYDPNSSLSTYLKRPLQAFTDGKLNKTQPVLDVKILPTQMAKPFDLLSPLDLSRSSANNSTNCNDSSESPYNNNNCIKEADSSSFLLKQDANTFHNDSQHVDLQRKLLRSRNSKLLDLMMNHKKESDDYSSNLSPESSDNTRFRLTGSNDAITKDFKEAGNFVLSTLSAVAASYGSSNCISNKRYRTQMNNYQIACMKHIFNDYKTPTMMECEVLGSKIGLAKRVIQVWFQNARAKDKKTRYGYHKVSQDQEWKNANECRLCNVKYNTNFLIQDHIFTDSHLNAIKKLICGSEASSRMMVEWENLGACNQVLSPSHKLFDSYARSSTLASKQHIAANSKTTHLVSEKDNDSMVGDCDDSLSGGDKNESAMDWNKSVDNPENGSEYTNAQALKYLNYFYDNIMYSNSSHSLINPPPPIHPYLSASNGHLSNNFYDSEAASPFLRNENQIVTEKFDQSLLNEGTPLNLLQISPKVLLDIQKILFTDISCEKPNFVFTQDASSLKDLGEKSDSVVQEISAQVGFVCRKCHLVYPCGSACLSHVSKDGCLLSGIPDVPKQISEISPETHTKLMLKLVQTYYKCVPCTSLPASDHQNGTTGKEGKLRNINDAYHFSTAIDFNHHCRTDAHISSMN